MSTVTVAPDASIQKDPTEKRVILFDWDAEGLADGVTISASTWTITAVRPSNEDPVALEYDNNTIAGSSRKTQARLTGGTLGSEYQVTNHITSNESPAQEKERSIYVVMVNK